MTHDSGAQANASSEYTAFLDEEGRRARRSVSVPNPAYSDGRAALDALLESTISSGDHMSLTVLLASLQVDMDWYALENASFGNSKDARVARRLRAAVERTAAALYAASEAETLLYVPTLRPVHLAVETVSNELLKYVAKHPEALHVLKPRQFEQLIAEVMESFGFDVELTPETRDGGCDVLAVSKSVGPGKLRASYVIECKKYREDRKVGVEVARQLLFVKNEKQFAGAIIATTSDFTSGVYDFAARRMDFDVRNAEAVKEWCRQAVESSPNALR